MKQNMTAQNNTRNISKFQFAACRLALVAVLMVLTTASAWALKTETKSYKIIFNGNQFHITPDGQSTPTASWTATQTNQNVYCWKSNDSHNFDGDMTIKPSTDVPSTSDNNNWIIRTNGTTTFTFTAPDNVVITDV